MVPSTPTSQNVPSENGLETDLSNLAIKSESDAPPTAINMGVAAVPKAPTIVPGNTYMVGGPLHVGGGNLATGTSPGHGDPPSGMTMERLNSPSTNGAGVSRIYTAPMNSTYPMTTSTSVSMTTIPVGNMSMTTNPIGAVPTVAMGNPVAMGTVPFVTSPQPIVMETIPFVMSSPLPVYSMDMETPPTISLPSIPPTVKLGSTLPSSNPGAQ